MLFALNRLRVLPVALIVVERQLQRLVFVRGLDLFNRLVHFGNRRTQRFRRRAAAAGQLFQLFDFLIQRRNPDLQPRDFALGLLNAPLDVAAAEIVQRLLLRLHLLIQFVQRGLFGVYVRLRGADLFLRRQKRRFRFLQLRAKLLLGLTLRARAKPAARGIQNRFLPVRSRRFLARRRRLRRNFRRRRFSRRSRRLGGGRFSRRDRGFGGRRVGGNRSRLRSGGLGGRFGQEIAELRFDFIHALLRRVALAFGGLQRRLRRIQRGLRVALLLLQRLELLFKRRCVRVFEVFNVFLLIFLLLNQRVALRGRLLNLLVDAVARAALQRVQQLLQALLFRAEIRELFLERAQQLLLLGREAGELLELLDAGLDLIELLLQLLALRLELSNCALNLRFACGKLLLRVVQPAQRTLFRARELLFAIGNLRLCVVELLLRVGQLGIHLAQNRAVENVDAVLVDCDVDLLRNHARRRDRRDAVDRLVFGNQRVLDIFG